jgi:hypothetical protein
MRRAYVDGRILAACDRGGGGGLVWHREMFNEKEREAAHSVDEKVKPWEG